MPLLEDKVTALLNDHPWQTAEQVALNLRARTQSVREVLASPLFSQRPGPRHSTLYALAGVAVPSRPSRSRGASQCDRVWAVLQDGRPHRMRDIHARAGFMRLNSRISELRKRRAVEIRCWREGDDWIYQLVASTEPSRVGTAAPSRAAWEGSAGATGTSGSPGSDAQPVAPDYQQLSLEQVA